jgi:hypothetical protein
MTIARNPPCSYDVAIPCSRDSYTIEIATIPSVARDDNGLVGQSLDICRPRESAACGAHVTGISAVAM